MNARARFVAVGLFLAALAAAPRARADEAEGRRHWKRGSELYDKQRYVEAAKEFEAGYAAAPRPLFLLNIGHAYRRANELARAKDAYQKLLTLQPDFERRAEVEGYIKSIDDALQAGESAREAPARPAAANKEAPPPPPPPPAPALVLVAPNTVAMAATRPAPPVPPPPAADHPSIIENAAPPADEAASSESIFRKPWFWVVVGAVVAGGVATAVIVTRPSSACPGTICITEK